MKVAILTWVAGTSNYGSVLQAYALQEYVKSLGFDVTVLNYKPQMDDIVYPSKGRLYLQKSINKLDRIVHRNVEMKNVLKRTQLVCDEFVSSHITLSDPLFGIKGLKKIANDYDVFICGSDQIWSMNKKVNPAYYLEWVPNTRLKIAYAPSLPVHNLNEYKTRFLKEKLAEFKAVSVREEETAKALNKITNGKTISVLDPTLLVDKTLWKNLLVDGSAANKDQYILCYFLGKKDFYTKGIEEIKKSTGLSVKLIPTSSDSATFGYKMEENVGPVDFIRLIKNAAYVITDSYHATIFSVIFHKEFYLFKRFNDEKNDTQNIRIYDLADKLQLGSRIIDSSSTNIFKKDGIDYDNVEQLLNNLQSRSRGFLRENLPLIESNDNANLVKANVANFDTVYLDKNKCSGCGACHDACPVHAIEMKADEIGYNFPVINHDTCLKCGKCRNICPLSHPIKNDFEKKVYIASTKDDKKSAKSSSGGVFPLLCESILGDNGVVYGAEIKKHEDGLFYVSHIGVESTIDVTKLYNSKYIQSNTAGIYTDVKEKLTLGRKVLFSGTPCQIHGLKNYLGKDYSNLFTIEVICHGVPSHKIFHKYMEYISPKFNGKITNIIFRDKAKGWDKNICVEYEDKNGIIQREIIPFYKSSYFMMFLKGDTIRDSCLRCPFASRYRSADLTLGDYWGAEYEHPKFVRKNGNNAIRKQGMSCVIINSDKGISLMEEIKEMLVYEESTYEKVALHNKQLLYHLPASKNRERYLSLLLNDDYNVLDNEVINQYSKASKKSYKRNNLSIILRLMLSK